MAGWLMLLVCLFAAFSTQVHSDRNVTVTLLESAVPKGAVCLDGSPPAYYYVEGTGTGASNWIVYLQGGGWCYSNCDCHKRSLGMYGNSRSPAVSQVTFSGLLDTDEQFNPDFYNWHKVFIHYCDGSSFMSNVEKVNDPDNYTVTYRGARLFNAVMEEMLRKGMGNAQNAILVGSSAGGLATLLQCDNFGALFPETSRVKCISDSGFFIHAKDLPGLELRELRFADVVETHKLAKFLSESCTSKMGPGLSRAFCFFPEYWIGNIQTPLFIIESAFDKFQVEQNLRPALGGELTNSTWLGILKDFRTAFIETLQRVISKSSSRGLFVHSCYRHGHVLTRNDWMGKIVLANKTIEEALGDWYFDRSSFQEIDTQNDSPLSC